MDTGPTFYCEDGTFYACQNGTFFWGCCRHDAEAVCDFGCPVDDVESTWFETEIPEIIVMQSESYDQGYEWLACPYNDTVSFVGCYNSNANGDDGCPILPSDDLGAATVATGTAITTTTLTYSTSAPTISPYPNSSSDSPFPPGPTNPYPTSSSNDQKASTGAIAGGAIGSFVAIAILLGALVFFYRRRRSHARNLRRESHEKVLNADEAHGPSGETAVRECKINAQSIHNPDNALLTHLQLRHLQYQPRPIHLPI